MAEKRVTKRKLQAEETKKKIFEAAIELIEKKGFDNITIQGINKHAGVSVGTFYHYYKSKEDVFFELYRKADEYFQNEVYPLLEKEELSFDRKIILFFSKYALYNIENGLEYVSQLYNTNNKFFIAQCRYMIELLEFIISDGQKKGVITTDMEAGEITDYLFVFGRGIVFDWCLHDGKYDLEKKMSAGFQRLLPVFLIPSDKNSPL